MPMIIRAATVMESVFQKVYVRLGDETGGISVSIAGCRWMVMITETRVRSGVRSGVFLCLG